MKITLVEASNGVLGSFDERMRKYALATLKDRGVLVQSGSAVTQVDTDHLKLKVKASPDQSQDTEVISPAELYSQVKMPYGSLVWAGGITSRPITKAIAAEIGTVSLALLYDCAYVLHNRLNRAFRKTAFTLGIQSLINVPIQTMIQVKNRHRGSVSRLTRSCA